MRALELRTREVPVALVHRLELAAVDRNARYREQTHLPAQHHEVRAGLADRRPLSFRKSAIVLWSGARRPEQPHQLDVALRLALQPPARLHPVEIAVDVELQQNRGMIRGPPGRRRLDPFEAELRKIELVDEGVDHPNRVVLVDPVFKASGSSVDCPRSAPSTKRLIRSPENRVGIINHIAASTSSVAFHTATAPVARCARYLRWYTTSGRKSGHGGTLDWWRVRSSGGAGSVVRTRLRPKFPGSRELY